MAALVAAAFAVPLSEIAAVSRRAPAVAFARQVSMYLARVALGMSYGAVGRSFGRHPTTAIHACRVVEECREDSQFDAMLTSIEDALSAPGDGVPPHALEVRP